MFSFLNFFRVKTPIKAAALNAASFLPYNASECLEAAKNGDVVQLKSILQTKISQISSDVREPNREWVRGYLTARDTTTGKTALHYAVESGVPGAVDILLNYSKNFKVEINIKDKKGKTPLDYSLEHCPSEKKKITLEAWGTYSTVTKLAEAANIDSKSFHGRNADKLKQAVHNIQLLRTIKSPESQSTEQEVCKTRSNQESCQHTSATEEPQRSYTQYVTESRKNSINPNISSSSKRTIPDLF